MKNKQLSLRAVLMSFLLVTGMMAYAQLTVHGTVIDAGNDEPIIGASVLEVGTTNGTITDFDGNFTLTVQSFSKIAISYMGYKTQELDATATMNVRLHEDSELLEEVVVVGYGVVKKNDATGSVTAIKPDEMNKGLTTNAQDMIQGKIAGVNVTSADGTPGGAGTIRIRGGASLNASNSPLIVIDGLAMDNNGIQGVANPLSMVNPSDIESFTVLKDASATAIYGSRASNGVIIITTKKGNANQKPKFSYEGNVSMGALTNRMEVLTGDQLREYATGPLCNHAEKKTMFLGTNNTDWQSEIYRVAPSTDHNLSIQGGTANMPYRFSIGYTLQNGIIKTSQMQRVTASMNLSPTFLDKHLAFNLNAKGMYIYNRYADGGVVGGSLSMDPTMPVRGGTTNSNPADLSTQEIIDKWFGGYYQRVKKGAYGDPEWPYTTNAQSTGNPVAALDLKNDQANAGSFVGNLEVDYKIHGFEDLRLHANFGADYSYGKQNTSVSEYSYTNHYYGWEGFSEKSKYNLQFSAYAQYYKDFSETQHFDIMIGYESQYFYQHSFTDGSGYYRNTHKDPALRGKRFTNSYTKESMTDNALQSYFGRLNWNGWNQVLLTATFRADGSSRFARKTVNGENARWGLFPSVALGWKIKETFLKDVNAISDFKLRLGYGITGQQDIGYDYYYMPTYTISEFHNYYPVGGESNALKYDANGNPIYDGTGTAAVDVNGNPVYYSFRPGAYNQDLTWEKTTTYNAGIDIAFLNNRLSMNLDYYYRDTRDLISTVNVPVGTNFRNSVVTNVGSLRNQGVEFAFNAVVFDRKNFKWDLGLNATWNDNKITSLIGDASEDYYISTGGISSGTGNTVQAHKVGYAASSFLVYETKKGVDADGNPIFYVMDRAGAKDANGKDIPDGKITPDDKYMYQSPDAKVTLGLQSKWQFYGVDLGITMRASIGNYVYNDVLASGLQWVEPNKVFQSQNGGYHSVLSKAYDLYWKTGFQSNNLYGMVYNADGTTSLTTFSDWFMSDYFVENASFLRVDNITLGYTFDQKVTNNKLHARIYCTVSNPFVITGYKGLDPEIFGGIDNNIYPRCLTTTLGCSIQF